MTEENNDMGVRELLKSIDDRFAKLVEILTSVENLMREPEHMRENRLYTRQQAANFLGVTTATIDRHVRMGELVTVKRGRNVLITAQSLNRFAYPVHGSTVQVLKL